MRFVPVESLKQGMIVARDIISSANTFVLKKDAVLSSNYIQFLSRKGYLGAYIKDSESENVELEEPISLETLTTGVSAVESGNVDSILEVAGGIVNDISQMNRLSIDLLDLRSFDDYTYHHSVNVAVYSVATGMKLGLDKEQLEQLSIAGLTHDLGKSKIPDGIISKNGTLSDEEYNLIKQHPKFSFDMLFDRSDIPSSVRQAVLLHHENEDGSGYPYGKESNEIPLMAKIIHVADVYDALTTKRPYKNPYTPVAAFDYLRGGKGILFNPSIVDAMEEVVPAYPVGVDVELSNGERALVMAHSSNARRPIVLVKGSEQLINLNNSQLYQNVYIKNTLILSDDAETEVTSLNEKRSSVRGPVVNVMVVDDSAVNLVQTKAALKSQGYNVLAFSNPVESLNHIREHGAPDLLIADIEMPILNGVSLVEKIRKDGHTNLPVIFLTGVANKETVIKCRSVDAIDYILKPANPTYLNTRIAIALGAIQER